MTASEPTPLHPAGTPAPDRAAIEALVAACIEAVERGESDPAGRLCADRPELRTHVQRRLSQLAARGLLPTVIAAAPERIGPYRIVRELGSGGMGTVYLAEQIEPVRRDVAVKVVKLGMDTREVVARFAAERQTLARMSHPHVAQVFDAGITPDGRPFFAMEFVAGEPLHDFCARRSLAVEQRVQLLATVCRAVQHAHDRGFIHRDLKPSNVLVAEHEGTFVPKIIDFGIAKAVLPDDGALRTRADQVLGTPEYMSPEQARSAGVDVDTRTDVYSLGVVLYELLCGALPFDSSRLRRASWSELERILTEELPNAPSQRLRMPAPPGAVAARGPDRTTLRRRVAGELDWITLKALHKQREQRYASALALAEDLERWLRHDPVFAAPPGTGYRLRKFVRRHRVAVGAGAAVVAALLVGLLVSLRATWVAQQAQQREAAALADVRSFYGLARDAVAGLVDVADQRLAEVPQADAVRRQMLTDAVRFYGALREKQPRDEQLRLDLLAAEQRAGDLQRRLGNANEAIATFERCRAGIAGLDARARGEPRVVELSLQAAGGLAHALRGAGRGAEARTVLRDALAELDAARARPDAPALDVAEAALLGNLAVETDDAAEALPLLQRALAAHERAVAARPDDAERQRDHARCQALLAATLTRQNRLDEAAAELAAATERLRALPEATGVALRETHAAVEVQFAEVLLRLGRRSEAAAVRQRAIDASRLLAAEHPDVPQHATDVAAGLHFLARIAQDEAQLPRAIELIAEAVAVRAEVAARHPHDHRLRTFLVRSLLTQAELEIERWERHGGDVAAAEATLARAAAAAEDLRREHGGDVEAVLTFAGVHESIAALHEAQARPGEALREHEAVLAVLQDLLAHAPQDVEVHYQLAVVQNNVLFAHWRQQDWARAIAAGEAAWRHLEQGLALDARHRGLNDLASQLTARLCAALEASGDEAGAVAAMVRLCDHPVVDAAARETGAMLLAQHAVQTEDPDLLERAEDTLRAVLQRRGPLDAAAARPDQQQGFSHASSRLRDLDLRLLFADVLGKRGDRRAQRAPLDEAFALAATMPELRADRLRPLHAMLTEIALDDGDVAAAERWLDALATRLGEDGDGNYLIAVLLTRCVEATHVPAERLRLAKRAVAFLRLAVQHAEVQPGAARHPNFATLRVCDDYDALLESLGR